jgi:hypothetical protein
MPQEMTAGARQTVDLADAWEPVLSLWYKPGPAAVDPAAVFNISLTVETASTSGSGPVLSRTEILTPSLAVGDWQHLAHRLGQPGTASTGRVTAHLQVRAGDGVTDAIVYVDEVSLGSGPGGPYRLLLPLARRKASSP